MKISAGAGWLFAVCSAASIAGCSSNSTISTPAGDAGAGDSADAGGHASDAGTDAGTYPDGGAPACTASQSYGTVTPLNPSYSYDATNDVYVYFADLNTDALPDDVGLQLYNGYGVFTNGVAPGTYHLTGAETSLASCGLCVFVLTDVDPSGGSGVDAYFATGGTVNITSVTPTLKATLTGLTFTHVNIDQTTGATTPVGDGCDTKITAMTIQQDLPVAVCTATADYGTVTPTGQTVTSDLVDHGYIYQANLNADPAPDFLELGLFKGLGVFANGIAPGMYTIAGADLDLATCGLCLLVGTDAAADGTPTDYYFATGGTVTVDTVTPNLAGKLHNITLTHVTFDASGKMVAVGDCGSHITELDFNVAVPPVVCTAATDYGTVAPIGAKDTIDVQNHGFIYQANLNADAAPDFLQIGLFDTFGVFANGIAPGTYTIAGAELDLGTCGLCVLIGTDAAADGTPTDYYFATGGTVKIDTVTPALTGKLLNVTFTHIVFDSNGNMVIADDCTTMLTELDFNSTAEYPACTAETDYGTVMPGQPAASSAATGYFYNAYLDPNANGDLVDLEFYGGSGAFSADGGSPDGGVTTGTFQIAGPELQYKTCGVCVLVFANSGADVYLATGGTVTLTALTPTLTGSVSNATFQHVLIDANYLSTPVGDDCVSKIDSMPFSSMVTASTGARSSHLSAMQGKALKPGFASVRVQQLRALHHKRTDTSARAHQRLLSRRMARPALQSVQPDSRSSRQAP
jgi:hypothetical protein